MKLKQFILFLFIILSSILIYHFRSLPTGQLWDDYTVFYVEDSVSDDVVLNAFNETGVKEYVSLAEEDMPVILEEGSLQALMFNLGLSNPDSTSGSETDTYTARRKHYFFDSSEKYRIYYIPNRFKDRLEKTVKYLDQSHIFSGVDSSVAYPWALPVIVLAAVIIVMFFVRKKPVYFFSMAVPVLFAFCNPFYSCGSAVLLTIIPVVMICNLWYRDGAALKILKNPVVWITLIISLVSAFAGSVFSGLYFTAAVLSQYAVILIGRLYEKGKFSNQTYTFVNIKPLKMFPAFNKKGKVLFPVLLLAAAGIFISYRFYSTNTVKSHFAKILLPGAVESVSENDETKEQPSYFPCLEEYYRWNWEIISYPLRSLNFEETDADSVVFPRYVKDENGLKRVDEVFSYDEAFKKTVYDDIDKLDFNNIEHVIKAQGADFICGYTTAKNYQVGIFSIIMIFICFFMLLFIYFSDIIKKGGRK